MEYIQINTRGSSEALITDNIFATKIAKYSEHVNFNFNSVSASRQVETGVAKLQNSVSHLLTQVLVRECTITLSTRNTEVSQDKILFCSVYFCIKLFGSKLVTSIEMVQMYACNRNCWHIEVETCRRYCRCSPNES